MNAPIFWQEIHGKAPGYENKAASIPAPVPATEHCMCPNCVAHRQYMADRRKNPPLALEPVNDHGRMQQP